MAKLKSEPDLSRSEIAKILATLPTPQKDDGPLLGRLCGLNLRGIDLSKMDLSYLDMCNVDLSGAILRGTHFRYSLAMGACFDGADMTGACLEGMTVNRASFIRAKLVGVNAPGLSAEEVNFTEADLSGAVLQDAQLPWCKWKGAKLANVDARGAMLVDLDDLKDATISGGLWTDVRQWGGSEHDKPIWVAPFTYGDATRRLGLVGPASVKTAG